jgi:hypothetical protein
MQKLNSKDQFSYLVLRLINRGMAEDKIKLFPCKCDCFNNKIDIQLFSEEATTEDLPHEDYSFNYSLKVGYFPFDLVKDFYSKISKLKTVSILINVNQICLD